MMWWNWNGSAIVIFGGSRETCKPQKTILTVILFSESGWCTSKQSSNLRKEQYVWILEQHLKTLARKLHLVDKWVCQIDNYITHTSKLYSKTLQNSKVCVLAKFEVIFLIHMHNYTWSTDSKGQRGFIYNDEQCNWIWRRLEEATRVTLGS